MNNRVKGELFFFFFLIIFSGILFLFDKRGFWKTPRGFVQKPILKMEEKIYQHKLLFDSFFKPIFLGQATEQQLTLCKADVQKLAVEQNRLSTCLEESEKMRKLLGSPLSPSWKFLSAKVVGISEQIHLDKGGAQGVEKGMVVLSENILVGKVVAVGKYDSLVQLPITPGVKLPVVVKRPISGTLLPKQGIQARGLLIGQYGQKLVLDRVLEEEDIQKGDLIVTSGDEGWLADLVVGKILSVLPKSAEIYQKAQVEPLVDYQKLRVVFIVTKF